MEEGLKRGYCPALLWLNMQLCMTNRVLRVGASMSEEMVPTRSIVAGLQEANNFAKLLWDDETLSCHRRPQH